MQNIYNRQIKANIMLITNTDTSIAIDIIPIIDIESLNSFLEKKYTDPIINAWPIRKANMISIIINGFIM